MKVHIFLASNSGIVMRGFRCCGILKNRNKILFQSHQLKKNLKKKLIWTMLSVNYSYKSKQNRIPTPILYFLPTNSTLRLIRLEWPRFQHAHSLITNYNSGVLLWLQWTLNNDWWLNTIHWGVNTAHLTYGETIISNIRGGGDMHTPLE